MLSFLKNHPFAVEAFFKKSIVLTFAIPKEELLPLIPECLSLDTHNDTHAFVAIAMVDTQSLRPKGMPQSMGNDFFLIGYRVFVRYTNNAGKRLRGLYILKSETNKKKMEFFGNMFTHYRYTTTDIAVSSTEGLTTVASEKSDFKVIIGESSEAISLPEGSPFQDWKEARRFAGPLPFTFTYSEEKKEVLIIQGVRSDWNPAPVEVREYSFTFLDNLGFKDIQLANAFVINNVPYFWKKGVRETWKQ
ncbi:uncharacterized protein DUF2071 [Ulvibacter sp. MAR_2010_11]|uniref:DUF2071 domain-containing protein n=1 Tax=Ulvibacter sp. MAR_2010_11 TaxID=1250229 RepID=UPI000C2C3279|nr:DUF2071 domain-containing protein [Ulvibacter sp. MAR_2010_11]PKA83407.1 uncharacterized protein DUF2071 [Ulvibacter sp. MAR_2010_11]